MNKSYEIDRLNYYINIFSYQIINFILCIKNICILSQLDWIIPFEIIHYIISIFIECKLYSKHHITCGTKKAMVVYNNKILQCPCNNDDIYEKVTYKPPARHCFHWNCMKDEILLSSFEQRRTFIYTSKGLKEYITNGGNYIGFINKYFPYNIISMASGDKSTLFHTKEGLFIDYDHPDNDDIEHFPLSNVILIACKFLCYFALTIDGLFSFGHDNYFYQLGNESNSYSSNFEKTNIHNVISVSCGGYHTLILTSKGLFGCGKSDYFGGISDIEIITYTEMVGCCKTPTHLNISNVISMSCGDDHSLILTNDGLYGCGMNLMLQSGVKFTRAPYDYKKIEINNILSYSCGPGYSIILTSEGLFSCGYTIYDICYISKEKNIRGKELELQFKLK